MQISGGVRPLSPQPQVESDCAGVHCSEFRLAFDAVLQERVKAVIDDVVKVLDSPVDNL